MIRPARTLHAKRNRSAVLAGLIVILLCTAASAGGILIIDADRQFAFAESLFEQQKFSQAAAEYERFVHFFPDDQRVELAAFKIGQSYFNGDRWQPAIRELNAFTARFSRSPLAARAGFIISQCYLKLGDERSAVATLTRLAEKSTDAAVSDQARYRIGWIHMEALDWEKARQAFDRISAPRRGTYHLPAIYAGLEATGQLPSKDPRVAGLLAVVPGAGFAYCGRYRDALIALVANGLVIWAAVDSFDNGNDGLGALLSVLGAGFYSGNIYGSIASAHKYNRRRARSLVERLKQDLEIGMAPTGRHGVVLALTLRF
jgi:tetratricopeptide (TPR) repeat protein